MASERNADTGAKRKKGGDNTKPANVQSKKPTAKRPKNSSETPAAGKARTVKGKSRDNSTDDDAQSVSEDVSGSEQQVSGSSRASDNGDSSAEDASDDEAVLKGFSDVSDEDDSDDDEGKPLHTITPSGVVKLPSSRDDAVVQSRLDKANKKRKESGQESTPIVLYFGRVPRTMPEDALRAYLTQFGDIRRLRLARNKKTGATKHYAFVEFVDEDVGNIVCETMNNYLLEGRLLQVHVVPKEKIHPNLWIGANRKYRPVPGDQRHRALHNKPRSDANKRKAEERLLKRQEQRRNEIKAQGIEYDFEGYV